MGHGVELVVIICDLPPPESVPYFEGKVTINAPIKAPTKCTRTAGTNAALSKETRLVRSVTYS